MPPIRLAKLADIEAIQAIELDAGRRFLDVGMPTVAGAPVPTAGELAPPIDEHRAWVATATLDGEPIGFAIASIVDGHAHLAQVSVSQAAGGQGAGRALIVTVEEWGRGASLDQLTLTTFRDVPFNGPLYLRLGFLVMPESRFGPELTKIRETEAATGLDDEGPRIAMIRSLLPDTEPRI